MNSKENNEPERREVYMGNGFFIQYAVDEDDKTVAVERIKPEFVQTVQDLYFSDESVRERFLTKITEDAPVDRTAVKKICTALGLSFAYRGMYEGIFIHVETPEGECCLKPHAVVGMANGKYEIDSKTELAYIVEEDIYDMNDGYYDVVYCDYKPTEEMHKHLEEIDGARKLRMVATVERLQENVREWPVGTAKKLPLDDKEVRHKLRHLSRLSATGGGDPGELHSEMEKILNDALPLDDLEEGRYYSVF